MVVVIQGTDPAELPDGSWINSTCEGTGGWNFRGGPLRNVQYRSKDKGKTWKRDAIVADIPGFVLTEAEEVLFRPDRVEIFGQGDKEFKLDATKFHDYRVVRDADSLTVFVDGTIRRNKVIYQTKGFPFGG